MELKFDPGFRIIGEYLSQVDLILKIFEPSWLNIKRQIVNLTLNIESTWLKYSPITRNPGSNFSSTSEFFRSKWLHFCFSLYFPCSCQTVWREDNFAHHVKDETLKKKNRSFFVSIFCSVWKYRWRVCLLHFTRQLKYCN